MSTEDQWITHRVTEARKFYSSLPETVASRLTALLRNQLTERQLTQTELERHAKALLAEMNPTLVKRDSKR